MRGRPDGLDRNRDGKATPDEILIHIANYARYRRLDGAGTAARHSPPVAQVTQKADDTPTQPVAPFHVPSNLRPAGLPGWFAERDRNGDGQLSLAEYAPSGSRETVASFTRLDANRDGLLTGEEASGKGAAETGTD